MVGSALRRALKGHTVEHVTQARSALERLASGERYDVIICDLMMPEMSGMEFFAEVSARYPELAFLSGGAFTPAAREFLDRVPNPRIEKPFEPTKLRAFVSRMIREERSGSVPKDSLNPSASAR